jgi:isopentenyl-diphosphate delta-isomerase
MQRADAVCMISAAGGRGSLVVVNDVPSVSGPELVVLLNEDGTPRGTAPKSDVHHRDTPLHLAFSCWVVDDDGRTLLTRRAAVKRTWPGIWTNTFCGHPAPGEEPTDAVRRRARDELGCPVRDIEPLLPDFRYRAVMDDGTVENEVCPVFTARLVSSPQPNPDEIDGLEWVPLQDLPRMIDENPDRLSPWMRWQFARFGAVQPTGSRPASSDNA